MSKPDNPPAFPSVCQNDPGHPASVPGMSLLDFYAAHALAGLCANPSLMTEGLFTDIVQGSRGGKHFAKVAGQLALALLAEWERRP